MSTMSSDVTVVIFRGMMCNGERGVEVETDCDFCGRAKCHKDGKLADQAVQRTASCSQSSIASRGADGRVAMIGVEC